MKSKVAILLGAASLASFSAHAVTLNLATDNSSPQSTTALTGFATTGDAMDGMTVRATFSDGFTQSVLWADAGGNSGSAVGTDWSLAEAGDTFGATWTLTNDRQSGLTRLFIDAGTGGTIYDVNFDSGSIGSGASSDEGTAGSARGWSFAVTSGAASLDILATYFGPVALGADPAVGDLYRFLDVRFQNREGLESKTSLGYITDTDSAKFGAPDIRTIPDFFSTGLALGMSGLGLAVLRRKNA